MAYSHTQVTPLYVLAGSGILACALVRHFKHPLVKTLTGGLYWIIWDMMRCLSVEVDARRVMISFGTGLVKKNFPIADIERCSHKRITPWHGWGIHWIGNGWVYNLFGLDAVELTFQNGSVAILGTDQPIELEEAINEQLRARNSQR
jgi:hypothetical protein